MKNIKYFIPIGLIVLCVTLVAVKVGTTCSQRNCDNRRVKNGKYCSEHTCEWEGCTVQKGAGKENYCYYHAQQNALQSQSEEIILTESQISKAKKAINEYVQNLMEKQSDILGVNLLSDDPDVVLDYVLTYRCNVVRKDSDMNLATIYVSILEDGTFKATKLLYD